MTTKAAILLTTLGALNAGIAGVIVVTVFSKHSENTQQTIETRSEPERANGSGTARVTAGCAPRPRCRPVVIPLQGSEAACELTCASQRSEEVERYRQMLEDVQRWCNPYCEEQLEECRQIVSTRYYDANGVFRFDDI